jgi:hypothetical protein
MVKPGVPVPDIVVAAYAFCGSSPPGISAVSMTNARAQAITRDGLDNAFLPVCFCMGFILL